MSLIVLCCIINGCKTGFSDAWDDNISNIDSEVDGEYEHDDSTHDDEHLVCPLGYIYLTSLGCQPICDFNCINSTCTHPNICTCDPGFVLIENTRNE